MTLILSVCDKETTTTKPTCNNTEAPFVSSTIDGILPNNATTTFNSQGGGNSFRNGKTIQLQGVEGNRTLSLSTTVYNGEGIYDIGEEGSEWTGSLFIMAGFTQWNSISGEINITLDCDSYMEGTFNFVGQTSSGSQAVISEGSFLVEF